MKYLELSLVHSSPYLTQQETLIQKFNLLFKTENLWFLFSVAILSQTLPLLTKKGPLSELTD